MSLPFTPRDYRPADLQACIELFDTNVPKFFRDGERSEYRDFLENLPGPYIVLIDDGNSLLACGGFAVSVERRSADLCWGMVRRELHGQGLGRALVEIRIERIRADPAVDTLLMNTCQHTVGFYHKLGFRTLDVTIDGYAPGLDRCEMSLSLR